MATTTPIRTPRTVESRPTRAVNNGVYLLLSPLYRWLSQEAALVAAGVLLVLAATAAAVALHG
jgi:hypothetical protein